MRGKWARWRAKVKKPKKAGPVGNLTPNMLANMIEKPRAADVKKLIRHWIKLLSEKRYAQAAEFLIPLPEIAYSAELLKKIIAEYNPDYEDALPSDREHLIPNVTIPEAMEEEGEILEIYLPDSAPPTVEYKVPLDGEWSQLFAVFRLVPVPGGLGLALYDMRVF